MSEIMNANGAGAPPLRMPPQVISVNRTNLRASSISNGAGVAASGLGGFIDDLISGDWESIGGSILDWVVE